MACWYKKARVVKGYHIYKAVWMPVIGEELHTKLEKDNEHAVAVILDGCIVGHLLRTIFLRLSPWLEALLPQCKTSAEALTCMCVAT